MFLSCLLIQPKHPRVGLYFSSIFLKDLREDDQGMFSIRKSDNRFMNILKLKVRGKVIIVLCLNYYYHSNKNIDANVSHCCVQCLSVYVECAETVKKNYGEVYAFNVPSEANILEFASINNKTNVKVVWNRTRANGAHTEGSRVIMSWVSGRIQDLTQLDSGYYNLRKTDNSLIWRTLLTVEGDEGRLVDVLAVPGQMKHSHELFIFSPQPVVEVLKEMWAPRSSSFTLPRLSLGL